MELLEVKGLTKTFKDFSLDDISFSIPPGFIMGYIGKNGAGKTTTLNAITHLIKADAGEIYLEGRTFQENPVTYREKIGYVGDASYFPSELTRNDIRIILKNFYRSFDEQKYENYMEKWELPKKLKIKKYSRGMKVKLMFASALARDTRILILDEATNGLDPMMRREILELLQDYIEDGRRSVLFSTHILEDLQSIADYIYFIDSGKKVLFDTKDELLETYLLVKGGTEELTPVIEQYLTGIIRNGFGFEALYDTRKGEFLPTGFSIEKPSIDEIMVHLLK